MKRLHLGVADLPYVEAPPTAKKGKRRKKKSGVTKTTGDVAEILEAKYHIIEIFYELHEEVIAAYFAEAMEGSLEDLLMGAPPRSRPYAEAESKTTALFKKWLSERGMDATSTPGVPTRAAMQGVNHRLKKRRGSPRPSFIDTGLYQSAFEAWLE